MFQPPAFTVLGFLGGLPSILCQTWSQETSTPASAEWSSVKLTLLSLCPNCRFMSTSVAVVLEATKS